MFEEKIYPYPSIWKGARLAIGCGVLAVFGFRDAGRDTRGMIIDGLITLRPDEAMVFRYLLAILMGAAAITTVFLMLHPKLRRAALTLGASGLVISPRLRRAEITIRYVDIAAIQHRKNRYQELLTVTSRTGEQAAISAGLLPSRAAFDEVRSELEARTRAAQTAPPSGGFGRRRTFA